MPVHIAGAYHSFYQLQTFFFQTIELVRYANPVSTDGFFRRPNPIHVFFANKTWEAMLQQYQRMAVEQNAEKQRDREQRNSHIH